MLLFFNLLFFLLLNLVLLFWFVLNFFGLFGFVLLFVWTFGFGLIRFYWNFVFFELVGIFWKFWIFVKSLRLTLLRLTQGSIYNEEVQKACIYIFWPWLDSRQLILLLAPVARSELIVFTQHLPRFTQRTAIHALYPNPKSPLSQVVEDRRQTKARACRCLSMFAAFLGPY